MTTALPGPGTRPLRGVALSLALLSTLAVWPAALDRWVLAKVLVLAVAALVAVLPAPAGRLPRWLVLSLAAAAALLVIAALLGTQPVAALLGRWPRYEGLVSATSYMVALWLGARLLGPAADAGDARLLDRVLAVAGFVLGAVSVAEAAGLRPLPSDLTRPGALLGNATDQGAVAAAIAVVLLARLTRNRPPTRLETIAVAAAASAAGVTVVLSGSRAALVALALGVVAASVLAPRRRWVWLTATLVPIAVLAVLLPGGRLAGSADAVADRLLIWREALRVAAAHPVLGTGPSGFLDAVAAAHDVQWFTSGSGGSVLDSPHDVLLQALVVGGPAALAGLMALIAATVVAIARRVRAALSERRALIVPAALGAGVLAAVLLTHVSGPATMIPLALLLGIALALPRPEPRPDPVPLRIGFALALTLWTGLVAATLAGETALATGVAAARDGRIAEADAAFQTAVSLRVWDGDTPVIAAEALTARFASGDATALRSATRWAQEAHTAAPNSLAGGKAEVTTTIANHDLDRAAVLLEHLRGLYPLDPWVAAKAGAVAVARGDAEEGERLLTRAVELDPTSPDPWLTLAFLYESLGEHQAAADAQAQADALGG